MPQGTITDADRDFVERWENIATSQNAILRLSSRGDVEQELIAGRRVFMVTTEERLLMQERVLDQKNDPFRNGSFRPLVVPDSVDKHSNPNALSDDEIRSVFASKDLAWNEWMDIIDSPETLRRMLDLADSEDVELSHKRYMQVASRLSQVKPKTQIRSKALDDFAAAGTAPATPDGRRTRGRGGMSSDYR